MNRKFNFILALLGLGSDVVSVSSGTVGNAGNVAADLITYLDMWVIKI